MAIPPSAMTPADIAATGYVPTAGPALKAVMDASGVVDPLARANISLQETRGPLRVLAIGDSLTNGNNDNNANGFGLLSYVNQVVLRSGGKLVMRRVMGIPGNTSKEITKRLFDEGLFLTGIDVAFVLQGTNDLVQSIPVATLAKNDRLIIRGLRASGIRAIMIAIPPYDANGAGTFTYNAAKKAVAVSEGAIWIDPWASARATNGAFVSGASSDGIHPNQQYTALAAQVILADSQIAPFLPYYTAIGPQTSGDLLVPGLNGDFASTYNSGSNIVPIGWSTGGNNTLMTTVDPNTGFGVVTFSPTTTSAGTVFTIVNLDVSALSGRRCAVSGRVSTTGLFASGGTFNIRIASGSLETTETDFGLNPLSFLTTDVTNGMFYQEFQMPAGLSKLTINVFFASLTSTDVAVSLSELSIVPTDIQGLDIRTRRQPDRIRPPVVANATLILDDHIVPVDATAGPVTITLPLAGKEAYGFGTYSDSYKRRVSSIGLKFLVIKTDSSANAVTIQRAGTDTIEGANTVVLTTQYAKATLEAIKTGLWVKI
jgi:lysophospholipase L1-like esterase